MSISAMKQAYAVPLIEQLESVPTDARMMYEHDKFHHENIPVGRLCHEAATALRQAIAEAEKPKMRRATREEKIVNPGVYQVPAAWAEITKEYVAVSDEPFENAIPLYTEPPKVHETSMRTDLKEGV